MGDLIEECVSQRVWAIVGYSEDTRKFGHIIYHDMERAGYRVYPVNVRAGTINGLKVYASVRDLPERPGVVNLVVPPSSTESVVRDCLAAGIERIWMQPGAESVRAIEWCRSHGIRVVYQACAMVEKKRWHS